MLREVPLRTALNLLLEPLQLGWTVHNDVLPELGSGPVLEVQTEALGLSSQEVEQYITVPLENNLLDGVMGVWDVRSNSIAGLSKVYASGFRALNNVDLEIRRGVLLE